MVRVRSGDGGLYGSEKILASYPGPLARPEKHARVVFACVVLNSVGVKKSIRVKFSR